MPPLLRRAARLAAGATALAMAALGAGAAPAGAVTSCTVNGTPASGPLINGTSGPDVIVCAAGVEAGTVVDGLGGDDRFTLKGAVSCRQLEVAGQRAGVTALRGARAGRGRQPAE